jgi:hypothetical protein
VSLIDGTQSEREANDANKKGWFLAAIVDWSGGCGTENTTGEEGEGLRPGDESGVALSAKAESEETIVARQGLNDKGLIDDLRPNTEIRCTSQTLWKPMHVIVVTDGLREEQDWLLKIILNTCDLGGHEVDNVIFCDAIGVSHLTIGEEVVF